MPEPFFQRLGLLCAASSPSLVAFLGVGSVVLVAKLEPLRPYSIALTAALLAFAFYQAYRPRRCEEGEVCAAKKTRSHHRIALWLTSLTALVLVGFPYYAAWVF